MAEHFEPEQTHYSALKDKPCLLTPYKPAYIFLLVLLISLAVQRIKPQPCSPSSPQESNPAITRVKYETAPVLS